MCKHIYAVRFWLALKQKLEKQEIDETEQLFVNSVAHQISLSMAKIGKSKSANVRTAIENL
mgnify:CR=1 FL=1